MSENLPWTVGRGDPPADGAGLHLVLTPPAPVGDLCDLTPAAERGLFDTLRRLRDEHGLPGYTWAVRHGETVVHFVAGGKATLELTPIKTTPKKETAMTTRTPLCLPTAPGNPDMTYAKWTKAEASRPVIDALHALATLMELGVVSADPEDGTDEVHVFHGWNESGHLPCNVHTDRLIAGLTGKNGRPVKIDEWHEFDCPTNRDFVGRLLSMRVRVCTRADDPVSQAAADRIRDAA